MTKHMPRYFAVAAATFAVAVTALVASLLVTGSASAGPASPSKTAQGGVPAKAQTDPTYWAVVSFQGTLVHSSSNVQATRVGTGKYRVSFSTNITKCARVATLGLTSSSGNLQFGEIVTKVAPSETTAIQVWTANNQGTFTSRAFSVVLTCP